MDLQEEPEDNETTKKLHIGTDTTGSLLSEASSELHSNTGVQECSDTAASSSDIQDQLLPPTQCTSGTQEHCVVPCTDSERSNTPAGAGAAAAAAAGSCWPASTAATTSQPDNPEISEITMHVCFSNVPLETNPHPQTITVEVYKQREIDDINYARKLIKSSFTERTVERMRKKGIAEGSLERLAGLVMEGKKVWINADRYDPRLEETEDIYEFYREWNTIESYQCLLISAPTSGNSNGNSEQRREEMENFCRQTFPPEHFDTARLDQTITWVEVRNKDEIRTFIRDFFHRSDGVRAKRALHAIIVFFGHGSDQGGFQTTQQVMPLDDITSLIKDTWIEALREYPQELPVMFEIIFTQCYAHLYDKRVQNDRFRVTAFTTHGHEKTTTSENAAGTMKNDELQEYAENTLRPKVFDMEVWRRKDTEGFVDLAAENSHSSQPTTSSMEHSVEVTDVSDPGLPSTSGDKLIANVNFLYDSNTNY